MFKSKLIYAIAISATLLSYSNLAHAQVDAKAVGDAVIANMGSEKTIVTIASSEMSGNNVVLKGIAASDKDGKAVTIGDVTLENVSEAANLISPIQRQQLKLLAGRCRMLCFQKMEKHPKIQSLFQLKA
jgi:hypothetical protein